MENWNPNPIFQCGAGNSMHDCTEESMGVVVGKWYFWIETWADLEGPFDTEEEAREALHKYSEML